MNTGQVLIYGAGGHAKVVADVVERAGEYHIRGILDDRDALRGTRINGYQVLGDLQAFAERDPHEHYFLVAIGDNTSRGRLAARIADLGGAFITAIHPSAQVARDVTIGEGTVVMANAVINTGTRIGAHVIVNTAATVDHDCVVEPFVHLAPGTHLAGHVHIGTGAQVGIGACAIPGVRIGCWTVVGAGATVVQDLPDHVTAVGTPAVPIRGERARV